MMLLSRNSMRSKESLTKKPKKKLLSTQLSLLKMSWLPNKKLKSMLSPRRLKMQQLLKRRPKKPRNLLRKKSSKRKRKKLKLKNLLLPFKRNKKFIIKLHQLRLPIRFQPRKAPLVRMPMKSLRKSKQRRKSKKKRKIRKQLLLSRTSQKKLQLPLRLPSQIHPRLKLLKLPRRPLLSRRKSSPRSRRRKRLKKKLLLSKRRLMPKSKRTRRPRKKLKKQPKRLKPQSSRKLLNLLANQPVRKLKKRLLKLIQV